VIDYHIHSFGFFRRTAAVLACGAAASMPSLRHSKTQMGAWIIPVLVISIGKSEKGFREI
jgi:hypothetical protein